LTQQEQHIHNRHDEGQSIIPPPNHSPRSALIFRPHSVSSRTLSVFTILPCAFLPAISDSAPPLHPKNTVKYGVLRTTQNDEHPPPLPLRPLGVAAMRCGGWIRRWRRGVLLGGAVERVLRWPAALLEGHPSYPRAHAPPRFTWLHT